MDKSLATVWLSWNERAEAKKKELGKTDQDLAEDVSEAVGYEISRGLVNAWFRNRRTPRVNEFMALCASLGADPGEVLFEVRVIHQTLPSGSDAAIATSKPAESPEYLEKQAERIRRFKAKKRRAKIVR